MAADGASDATAYVRLPDEIEVDAGDDAAGVDARQVSRASSMGVDAPADAKAGMTGPLRLSVCLAVMSPFQFGFNTGVINTPAQVIQRDLGLSNGHWGLVVSVFCISGVLGAQTVGGIADRIGRVRYLQLNALTFVAGGALEFASFYFGKAPAAFLFLMAGRFLIGLGSGTAAVLSPLYLSEISPPRLKGALGACNQLSLVTAILAANIMGAFMSTHEAWKWLLVVTTAVGLAQLLFMPAASKSPLWLLYKGEHDEALRALKELRGAEGAADVPAELARISKDARRKADAKAAVGRSWTDVFTNERIRMPLVTVFMLHIGQQLSGINTLIYYSTAFFSGAGLSNAILGTVLLGAVNALSTAVAVGLIHRCGRRFMLLLSAGGMLVSSVAVFAFQLMATADPASADVLSTGSLVAAMLFVAAFEFGMGPLAWQIGGEIIPDDCRSTVMSMGATANRTCNFALSVSFLSLNAALGNYTFVPFACVLAVLLAYIYRYVPETRGRTMAQVLRAFEERRAGMGG